MPAGNSAKSWVANSRRDPRCAAGPRYHEDGMVTSVPDDWRDPSPDRSQQPPKSQDPGPSDAKHGEADDSGKDRGGAAVTGGDEARSTAGNQGGAGRQGGDWDAASGGGQPRGPRRRTPGGETRRGRGRGDRWAAQRRSTADGRRAATKRGADRRRARPGKEAQVSADQKPAQEPPIPEEITPADLHREVRAQLRTLAKPIADTVARRLVAAGELLELDPDRALAHALAARRLGSRIAPVREAAGIAAYRAGEWKLAISELRAYQRLSGRDDYLAVIADCERALGRPERAIDIYRSTNLKALSPEQSAELLIVAAGARRDLGQVQAAAAMLQVPELHRTSPQPWVARLRYAYADILVELGRTDEAQEWFRRAVEADPDGETGAAERLLELEGVVLEEHDDEEHDDKEHDDKEHGDEEYGDDEHGDEGSPAESERDEDNRAEDDAVPPTQTDGDR